MVSALPLLFCVKPWAVTTTTFNHYTTIIITTFGESNDEIIFSGGPDYDYNICKWTNSQHACRGNPTLRIDGGYVLYNYAIATLLIQR